MPDSSPLLDFIANNVDHADLTLDDDEVITHATVIWHVGNMDDTRERFGYKCSTSDLIVQYGLAAASFQSVQQKFASCPDEAD